MFSLYSPKYKYILHCAPKAGCTYLRSLFIELHKAECSSNQSTITNIDKALLASSVSIENIHELQSILIVRNPYERLISSWVDKMVIEPTYLTEQNFIPLYQGFLGNKHYTDSNLIDFCSFLLFIKNEGSIGKIDEHFAPQVPAKWKFPVKNVSDLKEVDKALQEFYGQINPSLSDKFVSFLEQREVAKNNSPFHKIDSYPLKSFDASLLTIKQLYALVKLKLLPPRDYFYNRSVIECVESVYSNDLSFLDFEAPQIIKGSGFEAIKDFINEAFQLQNLNFQSKPSALQAHGNLDEVKTNIVRGWCAHTKSLDPISVTLYINDIEFETTTAKLPRPDVKKAGGHPTGLCGFQFEIPIESALAIGDIVRVKAVDEGMPELRNSPFFIKETWERLISIGDNLEVNKSWEKATEYWSDLHKKYPYNEDLLLKIGNLSSILGNYKEAYSWFDQIQKDLSNSPVGYLGYAKTLSSELRWEEAESLYKDILKRFPNLSAAEIGLSEVLINLGNFSSGETLLKKQLGEATEIMYETLLKFHLNAWSVSKKDTHFKQMLQLCHQHNYRTSNSQIISLPHQQVSFKELFNLCAEQDESKNAHLLIYAIASRLSESDLILNGSSLKHLMKCLPNALKISEEAQDWHIPIKWLSALEKCNLTETLPDWLKIEIIWMSIKLPLGRNLTKLKNLDIWQTVSKFDQNCILIDSDWIKNQENFGSNQQPINSLTQYFITSEHTELSPHPLFDFAWYTKNEMKPGQNSHALLDFFRTSTPYTKKPSRPNPYFDTRWYRSTYLEDSDHVHPLVHYIQNATNDRFNPNNLFSNTYIRETQSIKSNINPLVYYMHQLKMGGIEFQLNGFSPSPLFNRQYYLDKYADLKSAVKSTPNLDPYKHFILHGITESREAHPWQSYQKFVNHEELHLKSCNLNSPIDEARLNRLQSDIATRSYLNNQKTIANQLPIKPSIELILSIEEIKPQFLIEMIESIKSQTYQNWRLHIIENQSQSYHDEIENILKEYIHLDDRIKCLFLNKKQTNSNIYNDIIDNSNAEFVGVLIQNDLLAPDALFEFAHLINSNQSLDIIYCDEDKVDEWGVYSTPYYKPDWSPHSILSRMYVGNFVIYRKELIQKLGFSDGYDGAENYDLILRSSELTQNIAHIPLVLYHKRVFESDNYIHTIASPNLHDSSFKALNDALARRKIKAEITTISESSPSYIVKPKVNGKPKVEIIIPSRNGTEILSDCLSSIFEKSTYKNYRVTVVDNGSIEVDFFKLMDYWKNKEPSRFQSIRDDSPFNYSNINNEAAKKVEGEYLLFLNNDTEIITEDWIESLLGYAQLDESGAVGAKLLYPDETIQHAGVACLGGVAGHIMKNLERTADGYFNNLKLVTNYSAVTAACLMVNRKKFESINGFEPHLTVAFNDIDLCFKLLSKGWYNVYLPFVELFHYESKSRGLEDTPTKELRAQSEVLYMRQKWSDLIDNDPFYSPWLTISNESMCYKFH